FVGLFPGEAFVGDIDAPEDLLQLRAEAVFACLFTGADERHAAFAQFTSHIAEGLGAVGVAHVVGVGARRQVHADASGAPDADGGIGDFQHQSSTIFQGAAILVGTLVGAV